MFIACWWPDCHSLTGPGRAVQLLYELVPLHRCGNTLAYTLTVKRQREQSALENPQPGSTVRRGCCGGELSVRPQKQNTEVHESSFER